MAAKSQKTLFSWLFRLSVLALCASLVVGCALEVPVPKHTIMGSNFELPNFMLTLQTDTERAAFHVKLFTFKYGECASGNIDYLEFDGAITKETVEAFKPILVEAQGCKTRDGRTLYPFIYLNSTSGDYPEGYALGELFRRFNIETVVTQGQQCRGACAVAFLGGRLRKIQNTGQVVFASTKGKGIGIECERSNEQVSLRTYLQKVLDSSAADRFYFNLLKFCSQPEGLVIDAGNSASWSVTNE